MTERIKEIAAEILDCFENKNSVSVLTQHGSVSLNSDSTLSYVGVFGSKVLSSITKERAHGNTVKTILIISAHVQAYSKACGGVVINSMP